MSIISVIIALLALAFSCYTYFAHDRRIKRQEKILNEYRLRALSQSEEESKRAIIRAKVVDAGKGDKTLYICNVGKSKARNLTVDMPNSEEIYASRPSFPQSYEELLPDSWREIRLLLAEGDGELTLSFEWEDGFRKNNKETQTIDL